MDLYGMPILINDMQVRRPVKQVNRRMWHRRRCYADRVDKKWLKRYGTELRPLIADGEVLRMVMPVVGEHYAFQTIHGLKMPPRGAPHERMTLVMNSATYRRLMQAMPVEDRSPRPSDLADAFAFGALAMGRGLSHG